MPTMSVRGVTIIVVTVFCALSGAITVRGQLATLTFTTAQADAGKPPYARHCASCHGAAFDDGPFAPPLRGAEFRQRWAGKRADVLFDHVRTRMPPTAPGSLDDQAYANIFALLLLENGIVAGSRPLPVDAAALATMAFLPAARPSAVLSPGATLPSPPPRRNVLDRISPVTEGMLRNPPAGDWLTWRRTVDAQGFSPLDSINRTNVDRLRAVWTWTLPSGTNEMTPLVHDGVIFVHSFGDKVQALDAVTGDVLWQYSRRLPAGTSPLLMKSIAILGHRLYLPTSDAHLVALDVKTGSLVWDVPAGGETTGGPLVAGGNVILGMSSGGDFMKRVGSIAAFDAGTGQQAWRFATIAQPGEPGGDTWNDVPLAQRSGGNVWTSGSYDPERNVVLFGPAPTYDTAPLRNRLPGSRSTNDALFTNATVALNPVTGELAWHYQHLPNDQWDLDWAFERQIVNLSIRGITTPVVVTQGKPGIIDAMHAASGKYLFSIDPGLQNYITGIDAQTGAKTVDASKIPGDGTTKFVCPWAAGGRNWAPSAYNPRSKILFAPMNETCMDWVPVGPGESGQLSTGVRLTLRPPKDSDGKYGRLQAINLETRRTTWVDRQRAPRSTGVLATAGGLVFAGSVDRMFTAYDDATGKPLWSTRLNDVPNSNPITYSVDGKQYVAIVVGAGALFSGAIMGLVPEIVNPVDRNAMLWVFEVPGAGRRTRRVDTATSR